MLVQEVFKNVETVRYAFANPEGNDLVLVPFERGQNPFTKIIKFYYQFSDIAKLKNMNSSKIASFENRKVKSSKTPFNPQFLQHVGVFHGSRFCKPGQHMGIPNRAGSCASVFTDPSVAFLKKFKAGPAELDLVFDGGYGYAYFFKGEEFIAYDLQKKTIVEGYPKKVSTFLSHFGLKGKTFAALS